jgi:hypothetical protein
MIDTDLSIGRSALRSVVRSLIRTFYSGCVLNAPDVIIGGHDDPYMLRWHLIPRNPLFNIYLHQFLRSDDDRALHDHPWSNVSILLEGTYTEHRIEQGGIHTRTIREAGDVVVRLSGRVAHRIELHAGRCVTLFITGPRYRSWGFHCPTAGWVHWRDFTAAHDPGAIGPGCGDAEIAS